MAEQIYLLGEDDSLREMRESPYDTEALLQELLARYPNLLAGEQMDQANPRRWILVSREYGVPGEVDGSGRWSLDHLFIDQDAVPTLVEVKRSTDTRIRREVVGQLLDYAANAVSYWSIDQIRARYEAGCEETGSTADEQLMELLGPEANIESFWNQCKTNLLAGRLRLVFVADVIPVELRRVVEFLNRQMSQAEVLAVEIKQFVNGNLKTLVPKVIGQTNAPRLNRSAGGDGRVNITAEEYLAAVAERSVPARIESVRELLRWAESRGCGLSFNRGVREYSGLVGFLQGTRMIYPISCKGNGRLIFQMRFLVNHAPFDEPAVRAELQRRLESVPGFRLQGGMEGLPHVQLDELTSPAARQQLLAVLDWLREQLNGG